MKFVPTIYMAAPTQKTTVETGENAAFHNTLWSRVLAAGRSESASSQQALNELCRLYWYPLYAFLRRSGRDRQRARDLTQGFFEYLFAGDLLARANPQRGRFRSFLLGTLKNFVSHEVGKEQAQRRGGGTEIVSIDEETAEGLYMHEPASGVSPETLYDRRWAVAVLEEAARRLQEEHERAKMGELFEVLQPYLTGDGDESFKELGARIDRSEGATRVLVFRMRERFRQLIRSVIADTVLDDAQVEEELLHLQSALRGEVV